YDGTLDSVNEIKTGYTWTESRQPDVITTDVLQGDGQSMVVDTDYNTYGLPTSVKTYPKGDANNFREVKTTYSNDGENESADGYFVFKVTNALGQSSFSHTYPEHGQVKKVIDANSLTTETKYDAFGRVEQVTPPVGQPAYSRFALCDGGCDGLTDSNIKYKVTTYQAGSPQSTAYKDQFNRVKAVTTEGFDGNLIYAFTKFDKLGRKTFESIPSFDSTVNKGTHYLSFDVLGRLLKRKVDQADGKSMEVEYQYNRHRTIIDATDMTTMEKLTMKRTHSANGQLIQTTDALKKVTYYAYDAMGNPIVLKDANGNPIKATYNALGQKQNVNDPNMGIKTFTYSPFGDVLSETDAKSQTTAYTYDKLSRVLTRKVGNTLEASFNYDDKCVGGLDTETRHDSGSDNFKRDYGYTSQCQVNQVKTHIAGTDYTLKTQYDNHYGRVKALTYPTGLTVKNLYNGLGYQTKTQNAGNDYVYFEAKQLDARGQLIEASKANGVLTEWSDFAPETGQMKSIYTHTSNGGNQRHKVYYTYSGFGNLMTQTVENNQNAVSSETYDYDPVHRLTESKRTMGGITDTISYAYDAVGNITRKDDYGSSYQYGTVARGQSNAGPNAVYALTKSGGGTVTFGYDLNGNRTHENDEEILRYNAFNKPTWIKKNGITSRFSYGADQMRYKQIKSGKPNGTETTLYIDKAYEKIQYNGETQHKVYLGDAIVTSIEKNNSSSHKIGFVHRDRLGSVVTITDHQGNMIDNKSYDPFGKPRKGNLESVEPPTLRDVAYQSGFISEPDDLKLETRRGFTDHEHLDDAQLIHMNGRIYDYNAGRFLSVDPFIQSPGNSQSMNPYSYIMNNPLAGTDPSGYKIQCGEHMCDFIISANEKKKKPGNEDSDGDESGESDNGGDSNEKGDAPEDIGGSSGKGRSVAGRNPSLQTITGAQNIRDFMRGAASTLTSFVPFGEAAMMAFQGDWGGAFQSAAMEGGMMVAGALTGGIAYGAYKAYRSSKAVRRLKEVVTGGTNNIFYKVASGGKRGETPLTSAQRSEVDDYLTNFNLDGVAIRHVDDTNLNTGYLNGDLFSILNIGSDVIPGNVGRGTLTANSRVSVRGTLAHEIVGHREAALAGRTQSLLHLEEAQASIRAARFGPDLTSTERITLLRDGITRLHKKGVKVRDVKDQLFIKNR
ncbi:RHS repeat domain-containing protein, partial [Aliikangiella coralliicola]